MVRWICDKIDTFSGTIAGYSVQALMIALQVIIRKENPDCDADTILSKTESMFDELQEEVQTGKSPVSFLFFLTKFLII